MQTALPAALLLAVNHLARQVRKGRRGVDERDLVQEGCLAALLAYQRYDGRVQPWSFLRHRARGAMLDSLRRTNFRGKGRWMPLSATLSATRLSGTPSPEGHVLSRELRECVAALPWREAYVIERLYFGEETYQTVATELAISAGRVCQLHRAGLTKLRIFFGPP